MAKAWILVACVAACNSRSETGSAHTEIKERPVDPPASAPDAALAEAPDAPAVAVAAPPAPPPPTCLSSAAEMTTINLAGKELVACFDDSGDDKPDHCVRWRRDTSALISVETVFDVEATDVKPEPPAPVEFHTQDVNDDDRRLELTDDVAEICPPDRACMRLKPLLADGQEVTEVFTDGPYRTAILAIKSANDSAGRLEFWDLQTGRLRAHQALKSDSIKLRVSNSSALVFAITDDATRGAIYGLDGASRGVFAGGAHDLDPDSALVLGANYVIVDAPADKPRVIYVTSNLSGQTLAKFPIPAIARLVLKPLGGYVIATQYGDDLRFDVIDVRAKAMRTLIVPSC
jgi:hypothetical protein